MLVKATDIEGYTYSWRNWSLKKCTHLLFIIHDSLFIIHFFLHSKVSGIQSGGGTRMNNGNTQFTDNTQAVIYTGK